MDLTRAKQKQGAFEQANPDWRTWLQYDEQRGWQVMGEKVTVAPEWRR